MDNSHYGFEKEIGLNKEELIDFVEGLQYYINRLQEDLDRLKKELKKK